MNRIGLVGGAIAICLATLGSVVTASAENKSSSPTVDTESGPVTGLATSGENQFLGIPYAAPPVGALRWRPPRPFGKWHRRFAATRFGSICPQVGADPTKVLGNENCLFLNVYTPGSESDEDGSDRGRSKAANRDEVHGLPVMLWMHGGGFATGAGSLYDPTPLVKKGGVIVVTINYRLNVLGFFAHPALDAEGHFSANYGLMDQQFALTWVRRNIEAFGGDANRVTIFGESAGGLSVYLQLESPTAAGLFQRAIAESGAIGLSFAPYLQMGTLASSEPSGNDLATSVGCNDQSAHCLRTRTVSALVQARPFGDPDVDGQVITQAPGVAFPTGQFNRVPVISGTTHDEWRMQLAFNELASGPLTDAAYADEVAAFLGVPNPDPSGLLGYFLSNYPLSDYPAPAGVMRAPLALGAMGTDGLFACTARIADESLSQFVPTYTYEFNDKNAPFPSAPFPFFLPSPVSFPLGAYHGSELPSLFDVGASFSPAQRQLSDTMIRYWTQFAKTGNPNSAGTPLWSPYSTATDQFQSLVTPTPMVESNFATDHKCSVWGL